MGEPWEGTLDGEDALEKRQEADKEASGAAPGASWRKSARAGAVRAEKGGQNQDPFRKQTRQDLLFEGL